MSLVNAYDEIVDLLTSSMSADRLDSFRPSEEACRRVWDLIEREKNDGLDRGEAEELDRFMTLEHLMRMAKARARLGRDE